MKIGFVGTHGTGKTSLAEELMRRDYFNDYTFAPSSSRSLATRLSTGQSATPFSQLAITVARIGEEDVASLFGTRNTLSDRTPLDSLAYTRYQYENVWDQSDEEAKLCLEISVPLVQKAMRDFDAVIYFPDYGWPEENDGVRPQGVTYRREISRYCNEYLNKFKIKPYVVPNEPVDKRADAMVKWLKRSI